MREEPGTGNGQSRCVASNHNVTISREFINCAGWYGGRGGEGGERKKALTSGPLGPSRERKKWSQSALISFSLCDMWHSLGVVRDYALQDHVTRHEAEEGEGEGSSGIVAVAYHRPTEKKEKGRRGEWTRSVSCFHAGWVDQEVRGLTYVCSRHVADRYLRQMMCPVRS